MFIRILCVSFIVSSVALPVMGDDPREALRNYGNRMSGGTWHRTWPADAPDQHSYRWHFDDNLLVRVATGERHLAVIGVDPSANERKEWKFSEDGTVEMSSWRTSGPETGNTYTTEVLSGSYVGSYKIEHEADQISITPLRPSASSPVQVKQVWQRKPLDARFPNLDSGPPNPVPLSMSGLTNVVGFKRIDGQMSDGQKAVGSSMGRWILGGKFFLYVSTFTTEDQFVWGHLFVAGIDPQTGKATNWEFTNDGSVGTSTMSEDGRSITGKIVQADGSVFEFSGTFQLDDAIWKYTAIGKTETNPSMPYSWNWRDFN